MDLYLQFGHGMMGHCRELISQMDGTTVILSPRDLDEGQIERFSAEVIKLGGQTLIDPQLYAPRSDRHKLTSHAYWPDDYLTASIDYSQLLPKLIALNDSAGVEALIVPGLYCDRVNDLWKNIHDDIVSAASAYSGITLGSLCLSAETVRSENQLDELLQKTEEWGLDGYYVIAAHPGGEYLVEDPLWLSNLISFIAGIKLQRKKVVLGYSTHQMLCCACAGLDAIASGTYMNVRSFDLNKFFTPDPDEVKRKRTWYYCPQALSEVKPEFLDMAFQRSVIKSLAPLPECNSTYADMLFSGAIPTTTNYTEQASFRHYLMCLHAQCKKASQSTFAETLARQYKILADAEKMIAFMHTHGVRGQKRDFESCVDVNLSAIDSFKADKGFLLERMWSELVSWPTGG